VAESAGWRDDIDRLFREMLFDHLNGRPKVRIRACHQRAIELIPERVRNNLNAIATSLSFSS
jgi:hypothetical protein